MIITTFYEEAEKEGGRRKNSHSRPSAGEDLVEGLGHEGRVLLVGEAEVVGEAGEALLEDVGRHGARVDGVADLLWVLERLHFVPRVVQEAVAVEEHLRELQLLPVHLDRPHQEGGAHQFGGRSASSVRQQEEEESASRGTRC
jgi:hypothetical protein